MKPLVGTELKRFLRDYRKRQPPLRELVIVLQSVEYPYNVGAIFRLADGAGIKKLILTGITPQPPNPTIEKVSRGKTRNVNWTYIKDSAEAIYQLKDQNFQIVALELADSSRPYHSFSYTDKICLVVGHEDHGVTQETLQACDDAVFVPMFGKGRSHNVSTALAIVVYHILLS